MTNEIQRFDIVNSPGSGKFTLSFRGEPTDLLDYHPAAGDVQRALEALSTVKVGNVVVTKDGNWGYLCGFRNALGDEDLPLMEADDSQLGGGATIQVSVVTEGAGNEPPVGLLSMPCSVQELQNWCRRVAARAPGLTTLMLKSSADGISVLTPPGLTL